MKGSSDTAKKSAKNPRDLIGRLLLVLILFSLTYIFDIAWVAGKGFQGLYTWSVFCKFSGFIYLGISVVAFLIAPLIGRLFIPSRHFCNRHFNIVASWGVYITLMIVLLVNEELVSGRFSIKNPVAVIYTLLALIIPLAILWLFGRWIRKNMVKFSTSGFTVAYLLSALFVVLLGAQLTIKLTTPTGERPYDEPAPYYPHVLLVTLDTLRADHLNTYGYEPSTSVGIEQFANEAIVFENAFTPIPITNPAHATILTGNLPQNHLVLTNTSNFTGIPTIKPDGTAYENISVQSILGDNYFSTFAAVSALHLGNDFGWGDNFDSLNQYTPALRGYTGVCFQLAPIRFYLKAGGAPIKYARKSDEVFFAYYRWSSPHHFREFRQPQFAWLHFFDVHVPYNPPDNVRKKFLDGYNGSLTCSGPDVDQYNRDKESLRAEGLDLDEYIEYARACYDAEILEMDWRFNVLINMMKQRGIYDETLIIVCADHGEGIGEREFIGHNSEVVDYEMRVPLIIKPPGYQGQGKRISDPVTLCDIAPTIYDYVGVKSLPRMDGRSLKPLIDDDRTDNFNWPVPGMIFLKSHTLRWEDKQIVRTIDPDTEAIIWSYYNLSDDPGAFYDLYENEGILPGKYKTALLEWIDGTGADFSYLAGKAHENEDLDEWVIEQLRANGYLN